MTRERNWADNYTFKAARIHRPASIDEVRRLVAGSEKVHAIGTRHSFNGIADSQGDLIDLGAIPPDFALDRDQRTVAVGAGTRYHELAAYLNGQRLALHNMASLPHVSVIGAIATGTHGSGTANGTLSSAVTKLELITASGDRVSVSRGEPDFEGMVIGLGALGIVTRVTLDVRESFGLRQEAYTGPSWPAMLADPNKYLGRAYSVSLMTKWSGDAVEQLWLKKVVPGAEPRSVTEAALGLSRFSKPVAESNEAFGLMTPFEIDGPWPERLPHFLIGGEPGMLDQIQSEYILPLSKATEAMSRLRAMGERIDRDLEITELRSMKADSLWLSPAYGHDAFAIHCTWKKRPEAVAEVTRAIETALLPLGGRPHWGKLIHARGRELDAVYPKLEDFRTLVRRYDPEGKFRNAFLDAHVFG
jgi:xylitol oxidase